jgi:uncharacterized protein with GYD domain
MPVYMTQFSYTQEATSALIKNPEDRAAVVEKMINEMGGKLICMYFSFGDFDGLIISEAPDHKTALASILCAVAPGHVKDIKTTQLFTVEEAMEAMSMAGKYVYPAPKG